jgi:hypothetical protein
MKEEHILLDLEEVLTTTLKKYADASGNVRQIKI